MQIFVLILFVSSKYKFMKEKNILEMFSPHDAVYAERTSANIYDTFDLFLKCNMRKLEMCMYEKLYLKCICVSLNLLI